ncbi:hypothetical protein D3C86_2147440 [compost metagenome]
MNGLNHKMLIAIHEGRFLLCVGTPQNKHDAFTFFIEHMNDFISELFPSLSLVRSGFAILNCQNGI